MKWWIYVLCVIAIFVGTFFGIRLYQEITSESYVNGSIDISNKFSQESFCYKDTSIVLYHDDYDDTDTYLTELNLLKVDDFNGERKRYNVILNDFVIIDPDIKAGSVYFTVKLDFYDTNGDIVCNGTLHFSIRFLSGKTVLTLTTNGVEQARFFEQYFTDNGIRLKIVEIL